MQLHLLAIRSCQKSIIRRVEDKKFTIFRVCKDTSALFVFLRKIIFSIRLCRILNADDKNLMYERGTKGIFFEWLQKKIMRLEEKRISKEVDGIEFRDYELPEEFRSEPRVYGGVITDEAEKD